MRRSWAGILFIFLWFGLFSSSKSAAADGLSRTSCSERRVVHCGAYVVPANYGDPQKGQIRITYRTYFFQRRGPDSGVPTLIMTPGGPGQDSRYLDQALLIRRLTQKFHVVLWNPRGSPLSPMNSWQISDGSINRVQNFVYDLHRLIRDELNVDQAYLYGHSFGGLISLAYAGFYPQYVSKVFVHASLGSYQAMVQNTVDALTGGEGLLKLYFSRVKGQRHKEQVRRLFRKALQIARAGQWQVEWRGEVWTLSEADVSYFMQPIFQRSRWEVIRYLRGFIGHKQWVHDEFISRWSWRLTYDNSELRGTLYCLEFIPERMLSRYIPSLKKSLEDIFCDNIAGRRAQPIQWRELRSQIQDPVYVIYGERDTVTPLQKTQHSFSGIRRLHFVELPGTGHYGFRTRPNELGKMLIHLSGPHISSFSN